MTIAPTTVVMAFTGLNTIPALDGNRLQANGKLMHPSSFVSGLAAVSVDESLTTEEVALEEEKPIEQQEVVKKKKKKRIDNRSPAEIENEKFYCDETVEFWNKFQINGFESVQQNIQNLIAIITRLSQTNDGREYLLRHTARTSYFTSNALLGTLGFRVYDRIFNNDDTGSVFDYLLREPSVSSRLFLETFLAYEQDYQRVQNNLYKKPYDMYTNTRQSNPLFVATQTIRFVRESIGTLNRRKRGNEKDKRIDGLPAASSIIYPEYYQTAFHYQTDGWMSQDSANVYETSTETLFLGRQDAMQRTALPALTSLVKDMNIQSKRDGSSSSKNRNDKPMKVLEVACGTGRFMTFARDNLPLNAEYTAIDLSPYYLDAARENDNNWRKVRKQKENNNRLDILPAQIVQAKAEELPFDDNEFDAVICIYLFHELPRDIRARVAKEMVRVVRPNGGKVIFTDATQLGDRPVFDDSMPVFANMNEPYWTDYIEDNLPFHFENAGLKCLNKTVCSSTKTLSFVKE